MVLDHENVKISDKVGESVKKALLQAKSEDRLIVGLSEIVKILSKRSDEEIPIICLMAPPKAGDYGTHMQEVLLKAYCFENDIYIVHLDSSVKLSRIVDSIELESCAMICASSGDSDCEGSFLDVDFGYTKAENVLVDHCEKFWNSSEQPIVKLPEK
jgi:hypothetical protein